MYKLFFIYLKLQFKTIFRISLIKFKNYPKNKNKIYLFIYLLSLINNVM